MHPVNTHTLAAFLAILSFASATPIDSGSISLLNNSDTLDVPNPNIHCSKKPTWYTQRFNAADCDPAMTHFWDSTWYHLNERFEFLAPGSRRVTSLDPVQTPQRWTHMSCTVAIIQLSAFTPEELPGIGNPESTVFSKSDITTYPQLVEVSLKASRQCLERRPMDGMESDESQRTEVERREVEGGRVGNAQGEREEDPNFVIPTAWAAVGDRRAVGLFLWDAWSYMNTVRFPEIRDGRNNGTEEVVSLSTAS